ncbi:flowering locus K homology domain-like [Iris pallida]|uniref:Secretory carrier-associated membrane protein n=1 Tax=Iris pallida TaxID=29817 RepID=A0AAX6GP41_IRIPA|nr:flowering locus K homology domain-like [Iris pallida]
MHSVVASVLMTSMLSFTRGGYGCLSDAGIIIEEKNWPSFSPIIHHNIAGEIPIHLQRLLYFAFASLLGMLKTSRTLHLHSLFLLYNLMVQLLD